MSRLNELGQPIGDQLTGWAPAQLPPGRRLAGRYVVLRPMSPDDAGPIYRAFEGAPHELWTYMGFEPFDSVSDVVALIESFLGREDWFPYVAEVDGSVRGFASYLRVNQTEGTIEIGSILWSPDLQRTPASTEAVALMLGHVFELGYRRVEWKCDALNEASRRAADRLGFVYEGTFRKATHYKGRNRDTAWYSMTDDEWPQRRAELDRWLDPTNFDVNGRQLSRLRT